MKITIITGSPQKNGTSAMLADAFARGAEIAGHEVTRFDSAFRKVHPCIACEQCHTRNKGVCVFQDDMTELSRELEYADYVVLATPMYYFGISAQLKAVIDRFYANNEKFQHHKKVSLLLTMADVTMPSAESVLTWLHLLAEYMDWEEAGNVIALNCWDTTMPSFTRYENEAREMGFHASDTKPEPAEEEEINDDDENALVTV